MKKIILTTLALLLTSPIFALDESTIIQENSINTRINNVGTKILNSNKIEKRIIFVYDKNSKLEVLRNTKSLTKRQVVIYKDYYKFVETEDELAAYIAREIPVAVRSYDGIAGGWLSSIKIKAAPKKYELVFDKFAIDYMVKAGYNPLGLITFINKSYPQKRQDTFSGTNLTSKRLAHIYEHIYINYPSFLANNTYIGNEHYQNFLLTSQKNRKLLQEKIIDRDWKRDVKYE